MIDPRASTAVALLALVPVGLYLFGVVGDTVALVASTACVLLVAASLYVVFGSETASDRARTSETDGEV